MRFFVQKFLVFGFLIFIQFFVVSFAYAVVTRATPSLGLVGWWKMDESSWNGTSGEIRDSTWYARNGTSYSGATTAAGKFTRAGYFDGNNDYAQYSASIIPLGAKTVAFWFNDSTPINTEGDIVSTTNGSPSHGMIIYRADTSGKITCLSTKGTAGTMRFGLASTRSFNDGAWHHVACVWDGTTNANGAKLYIDGVADGQATAVATETTAQTYSLTLGKTPSASGNWYRGFLDDLRIYSRALSAGEIAVLYASKPATATNVNKTVAKNNSAVNLQNGLVGHWTFDGKNMTATQATDIAGGNTGTLTGGVTKVTGKIGQGLKFDGGSGYVNLGSVAALNPTNITVSAWVFAKNIPAGGVSYYGMQNAGGNIYRATDVDASGNLYWMQSDGSGNRRWYQTNSPVLSLNKWYHVVVTQTGATAPSIFVDGVLAPSSVVLSQGNEVVPSTQISTIGRQGAWATDLYWNGYVDDVRIYNRALNAAEIAALYTAGAPTKTSVTNTNKLTSGLVGYWTFDGKNMTATQATDIAGGNTGTLTGGVTKVAGKIGQALKFDGSSGYINTSYLSQLGANSFSMSFWFKTPTSQQNTWIIGFYNSNAGPMICKTIGIMHDTNSNGQNKVGYWMRDSNCIESANTDVATTASNDSRWHHMVLVVDRTNNNIKGYYDGINTSNENKTFTGSFTESSRTLYIGAVNAGSASNFYNGSLDDVRIYNRALSTTEVTQLYNVGR